MDHQDHVRLIKKGISKKGGVWADFGSGDGAFTFALRDVIGNEGEIYSIDKNIHRLEVQKKEFNRMFPGSKIHYMNEDFTRDLQLPLLDGIIMANSLHFIKDKELLLFKLKSYLKPYGIFILVEYNSSSGNTWVPYPVTFEMFRDLAEKAGFEQPQLLDSEPSGFMNEIYSATTSVKS